MIRQDRFLLGILAGIVVLVLAALVMYLTRQTGPVYGPEDTPAGVVQNFTTALVLKDYERAFGYVAGPPGVQTSASSDKQPGLPDLAHFSSFFLIESGNQLDNTGLQVGEVQFQNTDTALVSVTVLRTSGSLFNSVSRETQQVELARQNGAWKITRGAYPFWNYAWAAPLVPGKTIPVPAVP